MHAEHMDTPHLIRETNNIICNINVVKNFTRLIYNMALLENGLGPTYHEEREL